VSGAEHTPVEMIRCPDPREPSVHRCARRVAYLDPASVKRVEPEINLHGRHL
jgi:hypothetical protein